MISDIESFSTSKLSVYTRKYLVAFYFLKFDDLIPGQNERKTGVPAIPDIIKYGFLD